MIVLSSATTGWPVASASRTSSCTCTCSPSVLSAGDRPIERPPYQVEGLILPHAECPHRVGVRPRRLLGGPVRPIAVHDGARPTPRRNHAGVLELAVGPGDGVGGDTERLGEGAHGGQA